MLTPETRSAIEKAARRGCEAFRSSSDARRVLRETAEERARRMAVFRDLYRLSPAACRAAIDVWVDEQLEHKLGRLGLPADFGTDGD